MTKAFSKRLKQAIRWRVLKSFISYKPTPQLFSISAHIAVKGHTSLSPQPQKQHIRLSCREYEIRLDQKQQRPTGQFIAVSNRTFKGTPVANDVPGPDAAFWTGGSKTGSELARQEVWFYRRNA